MQRKNHCGISLGRLIYACLCISHYLSLSLIILHVEKGIDIPPLEEGQAWDYYTKYGIFGFLNI